MEIKTHPGEIASSAHARRDRRTVRELHSTFREERLALFGSAASYDAQSVHAPGVEESMFIVGDSTGFAVTIALGHADHLPGQPATSPAAS